MHAKALNYNMLIFPDCHKALRRKATETGNRESVQFIINYSSGSRFANFVHCESDTHHTICAADPVL